MRLTALRLGLCLVVGLAVFASLTGFIPFAPADARQSAPMSAAISDAAAKKPIACAQPGETTYQQCSDDPSGTKNCACKHYNNICNVPITLHYTITAPPGARSGNSAEEVPLARANKKYSSTSICLSYSGQTLVVGKWEERPH